MQKRCTQPSISNRPKKVVVTGLGLITPIGLNRVDFWEACQRGDSGVNRITVFEPGDYATQIAAELKNFDPSTHLSRSLCGKGEIVHQMGLVAAIEAVEDAGIDETEMDRRRTAVCAGSGLGTRIVSEERLSAIYLYESGVEGVPLPIPCTLGDYIADHFQTEGPMLNFSNACATGNHSLGWGFNLIRMGKADVVIAGCAEAPILPLTTAGFCAMRAMSTRNDDPRRASRPFDRKRDGFVLGEGAAFLILEPLDRARKRGARIYAEIAGYSMTAGAYHMALPHPTGEDLLRTMSSALRDAKLDRSTVNYINAHGTSTPKNDSGETLAIKKLFNHHAYEIPISSTKSMIGHTLGASGAIELSVCALSIKNNVIPPTINYEFPDPECDLDYVPNEARQLDVDVALSNSFGFGGTNSTIVVKKL